MHAPGPWETSRDAVPEGHVQTTIYDATGTRVATVFGSEDNVDLIQAAPELLRQLEALVVQMELGGKFIPPQVRAVISDAKGVR